MSAVETFRRALQLRQAYLPRTGILQSCRNGGAAVKVGSRSADCQAPPALPELRCHGAAGHMSYPSASTRACTALTSTLPMIMSTGVPRPRCPDRSAAALRAYLIGCGAGGPAWPELVSRQPHICRCKGHKLLWPGCAAAYVHCSKPQCHAVCCRTATCPRRRPSACVACSCGTGPNQSPCCTPVSLRGSAQVPCDRRTGRRPGCTLCGRAQEELRGRGSGGNAASCTYIPSRIDPGPSCWRYSARLFTLPLYSVTCVRVN